MADGTPTPDALSTVPLKSLDGDIRYYSPQDAQTKIGTGYSPASPQDFEEQKYTTLPQQAAAHTEAGLSGLTAGLSDVLEKNVGEVPAEDIEKRRRYNPSTRLTEMLGAGVPLALGVEGLAPGIEAASLAEKGFGASAALAADAAEGSAARTIGSRMLAGSIVGGAYGAGKELSEEDLGDMPFNVEAVLEQGGMGIVGGGLGEGLFGIAGRALSPAARLARGALGKLGELGESAFDRTTALASGASADDIRALRLRRAEAAAAGGYGPMAAQDVAKAESGIEAIHDNARAEAEGTMLAARKANEEGIAERAAVKGQAKEAGETAFGATKELRDATALEGGKALKDFHENIHPAAKQAQGRLVKIGEQMMEGQPAEDVHQAAIDLSEQVKGQLADAAKLPPNVREPAVIQALKTRVVALDKALEKLPAVGNSGYTDQMARVWHAVDDLRKGAQADGEAFYDQLKQGTLPWSKRPTVDIALGVARQAADLTKAKMWNGFGEEWQNFQEPYSRLLQGRKTMLKSRNFLGYDQEAKTINPQKYAKYIKEIHTDPTAARGQVLDSYLKAGNDVLGQIDKIHKTPLASKDSLRAMLGRMQDIKAKSLDMTAQLKKGVKGYKRDALAAQEGRLQDINSRIDAAKDIRRQGVRDITEQNINKHAGDLKPLEEKLTEAQRVQQMVKDLSGGSGMGLGRLGYASFIGRRLGLSWAEMGPLMGAYAMGKLASAPVRLLEGYTQIEMAARAMEKMIGEDTKDAFKAYLSKGSAALPAARASSYKAISNHLFNNPLSAEGENQKDEVKAATQLALDVNNAAMNPQDSLAKTSAALQFIPPIHGMGLAAKFSSKIGRLKMQMPILLPPVSMNGTPSMTSQDAMKYMRTFHNVDHPVEALNMHLANGDLQPSDLQDAQSGGEHLVSLWQNRLNQMVSSEKDIPLAKQAQIKIALGQDPHRTGYATVAQSGYAPAQPPPAPPAGRGAPGGGKTVNSSISDTEKFKSELANTERLPADRHPA